MSQINTELSANSLDKKSFKDRVKALMSGISGAFMFPIATLAILAFFLSIGGALESAQFSNGLSAVGSFIKRLFFPLLQAIPVLFCVAFAASFCKNDVTYVWSAFISYLVFISVQGVFIDAWDLGQGGGINSLLKLKVLIDKTFGIKSFNTSIFGSFMVGGILIPYIQRKWSNVTLKGPFAFFSGKRFVPFVSSVFGAILGLCITFFWPFLGYAFSVVGNFIAKTPYGIDSFIFGFLEKSLIPFGLHHAFYAPLWYSSLGGDVIRLIENDSNGLGSLLAKDGYEYSNAMWLGDSFIGMSVLSLPQNQIGGKSIMEHLYEKGIKVGRFTQGKFPIMQFCLPSAAFAMVMAAPKERRREALKVLLPAAASSFFMGITEPVEFTFLFMAPKLFYGFHAVFCGISFALMNCFGAHIPSIFSGGLIEFILLGVIPWAKGTNFWFHFAVGAILAPIYFVVFLVFVKLKDLQTPGRTKIEGSVEGSSSETVSRVPEQTRKLAIALGGWDNVSKYTNCASRLRYDIVDKSKVDEAALKAAGVIAIKWVGDNHAQIIVGPQAESINNEMLKWKGEDLGV